MGIIDILLSKAQGVQGRRQRHSVGFCPAPCNMGQYARQPGQRCRSFAGVPLSISPSSFSHSAPPHPLSVFPPAQFFLLPSAALAAPPVDSRSSAVPTLHHSEYDLSSLERVFRHLVHMYWKSLMRPEALLRPAGLLVKESTLSNPIVPQNTVPLCRENCSSNTLW